MDIPGPSTIVQPDIMDEYYDQYASLDGMITDALSVNVAVEQEQSDQTEDLPNEEVQRFYNLLKETNKPLFEGSTESMLSVCVILLGLRSIYNATEKLVNSFVKLMLDTSPIKSKLPSSYYEAKQLVSKLGLDAKRIDCCVKGCMLFYDNEFGKNDAQLTKCRICNEPRYHLRRTTRSGAKPLPRQAMSYLSIVTRLQILYASMQTAPKMTWHHENRNNSGKLQHPSDGEAWKHFDRVHHDFATEPRNVRLGLCSYGFTPYVEASARGYSCWPIMVTPYNLPPEMCMTKPYMFLAAVLPGPNSPTQGIDIYLQPLIDDLKRLWTGVTTYDISKKENFTMRAALMWTINDFSAYEMLSGWSTHGKLGCPVCMEDTKAFTLKHGEKPSWFDSHRRFLNAEDEMRADTKHFVKGQVEQREAPCVQTPREVWEKVRHIPKIEVVNGETTDPAGCGSIHNWKKQSIFWELPYWKDNLLRHNLDVMYVEKNFFDNIFNTVMNVRGKNKDNEKARKDLSIYCDRPELEYVQLPNGKTYKPKAAHTLNHDEVKAVYRWISELKMPDGYCSNIAKCVNIANYKMTGMKSHDCHVFLECLLPIAFSKLQIGVLAPLVEISCYFKNLCAATLTLNDLREMEHNIAKTLCKLEMVFPPSFFDFMEHITIHLAHEARLGGPVQYRWMYPFERFMGDSKKSVRNKVRVEGSICASYLEQEAKYFFSYYFNEEAIPTPMRRNEVIDNERRLNALSVFQFPGHSSGRKVSQFLSPRELYLAHANILGSCKEVEPYLQLFLSIGYSDKQINSYFPIWFRQHVYSQPPTPLIQLLQNLSDGPNRCAKELHTYSTNGYKFHTHSWTENLSTVNSGVYFTSDTGKGEIVEFYGVIQKIYEIEYTQLDCTKTIVLFYCDWFDSSPAGTRIDPITNTVNIKTSGRYPHFDPFVFAYYARQVYYVPYPSTQNDKREWVVAIKTRPRDRLEEGEEDVFDDAPYQVAESTTSHLVVFEPCDNLCDGDGVELDPARDDQSEGTEDREDNDIDSSEDEFEDEYD